MQANRFKRDKNDQPFFLNEVVMRVEINVAMAKQVRDEDGCKDSG